MTIARHHAIIIDGDRIPALERARVHIQDVLQLSVLVNPDVSIVEHDRFGIGEARALKERAHQTPLGIRQVFVLAFNHVTHQAQNSLLKLLEEPPDDTYFILIVPTIDQLLTTVRSRVQHLATVHVSQEQTHAATFYQASIGERIQMVAPIVAAKDRTKARDFIALLEGYVHARGVENERVNLAQLAFVQQYIGDTASSVKMLLEHIAITMRAGPERTT